MSKRLSLAVVASAFLGLIALTPAAQADGRYYNDGPVVNVASIRTVDGRTDEYLAWLASGWKQQQEALKKAGLITGYRVLLVEARGPNDPDVYLITEYKNWAALDNSGSKGEAVLAQLAGSLDKANQAEVDRAKIRTVLGSQTMQEAILK